MDLAQEKCLFIGCEGIASNLHEIVTCGAYPKDKIDENLRTRVYACNTCKRLFVLYIRPQSMNDLLTQVVEGSK